MKRGRRVFLVLLVCGVVALVAALVWPREKEPEYQGKKLSEWLDSYHGLNHSPEAASAVRQIGANGVPFLTDWISYDYPPNWSLRTLFSTFERLRWRRGTDLAVRLAMRRYWRREKAVMGFEILGETAKPAVPELVRIMNRWRWQSSCRAMEALRFLGRDGLMALATVVTNRTVDVDFRSQALSSIGGMNYLGTNADVVVPILLDCLRDPEVAESAAASLGALGRRSDLVVPALTSWLESPKLAIRNAAIAALGNFGPGAQAAVPSLVRFLKEPGRGLASTEFSGFDDSQRQLLLEASKIEATDALRRIAPKVLEDGHLGMGTDVEHGTVNTER